MGFRTRMTTALIPTTPTNWMPTRMALATTVIQMLTTTEFQTLRTTAHLSQIQSKWTTTMMEQETLASGTTTATVSQMSSTRAQGTPRSTQQVRFVFSDKNHPASRLSCHPSHRHGREHLGPGKSFVIRIKINGNSLFSRPHNGSSAMRERKSCRKPTLLQELPSVPPRCYNQSHLTDP